MGPTSGLAAIPAPSLVPINMRAANGKLVSVPHKFGAIVEPDPNRVGYARLARFPDKKGCSPLRGGRSYTAAFSSVTNVLGAGGTGILDIGTNIQEGGYLGQLVLDPIAADLYITDIKIAGDSLVTGDVPFSVYAPDSIAARAWFGQWIDPNTKLSVSVRNDTGAAIDAVAGFTLI
jgi:hypothetical protein